MTNNDLAWAIYEALKEKGAIIGTASVGIIERKLDQAEAKRWIPVAERLPEVHTEVILTTRYGGKFVGYLCDDGRWESEGAAVLGVTRWQPLPEGPEAE